MTVSVDNKTVRRPRWSRWTSLLYQVRTGNYLGQTYQENHPDYGNPDPCYAK